MLHVRIAHNECEFVLNIFHAAEHSAAVLSAYVNAVECAEYRGEMDIVGTYFQSQFPQVVCWITLDTIILPHYRFKKKNSLFLCKRKKKFSSELDGKTMKDGACAYRYRVNRVISLIHQKLYTDLHTNVLQPLEGDRG